MRISDWSSDVCSSDLTNDRAVNAVAGLREGQDAKDIPAIAFGGGSRSGRGCRPFRFIVLHAFLSYNLMSQHSRHASGRHLSEERSQDRKSVVSGQGVSVRVDLGCGASLIQKKKR